MKRKISAILLVLVLLVSQGFSALAVQTFTDVPQAHWARENIRYVVEKGYFIGTSTTTFSPNQTLERAMLAQVLYRHAGEPATGNTLPYSDVNAEAWYAESMTWASENNIFASWVGAHPLIFPKQQVQRSEFAVMLRNYARYLGKYSDDETESTASPYIDMAPENFGSQDGNWVEIVTAMLKWAVPNGILNGASDTTMNPFKEVSRAEVSAMLHRFDHNVLNASSNDPVIVEVQVSSQPADEVIRLTNIERVSRGLPPLLVDAGAMKAAQIRAEELSILFDHKRPDGQSCFAALDEAGVDYRSAGENIALGHSSAEKVVAAWVESKGHLSNMMNERFRSIGVGYTAEKGWVQMFID